MDYFWCPVRLGAVEKGCYGSGPGYCRMDMVHAFYRSDMVYLSKYLEFEDVGLSRRIVESRMCSRDCRGWRIV